MEGILCTVGTINRKFLHSVRDILTHEVHFRSYLFPIAKPNILHFILGLCFVKVGDTRHTSKTSLIYSF